MADVDQHRHKLRPSPCIAGTPFFACLGNEYDFYGDAPDQITQVQIENERMPKELFFIPALLLLMGIVLLQGRRATQPAF
ncbi:MAG: DUF3394 domain-containing protein [Pseudomonadota bacterium]